VLPPEPRRPRAPAARSRLQLVSHAHWPTAHGQRQHRPLARTPAGIRLDDSPAFARDNVADSCRSDGHWCRRRKPVGTNDPPTWPCGPVTTPTMPITPPTATKGGSSRGIVRRFIESARDAPVAIDRVFVARCQPCRRIVGAARPALRPRWLNRRSRGPCARNTFELTLSYLISAPRSPTMGAL
jgi:hypothetical protein